MCPRRSLKAQTQTKTSTSRQQCNVLVAACESESERRNYDVRTGSGKQSLAVSTTTVQHTKPQEASLFANGCKQLRCIAWTTHGFNALFLQGILSDSAYLLACISRIRPRITTQPINLFSSVWNLGYRNSFACKSTSIFTNCTCGKILMRNASQHHKC